MPTNKLPTKAQARVLKIACIPLWVYGDTDRNQRRHCVNCCREGWMRDSYDGCRLIFKIREAGRLALAAYEAKHGEVEDA